MMSSRLAAAAAFLILVFASTPATCRSVPKEDVDLSALERAELLRSVTYPRKDVRSEKIRAYLAGSANKWFEASIETNPYEETAKYRKRLRIHCSKHEKSWKCGPPWDVIEVGNLPNFVIDPGLSGLEVVEIANLVHENPPQQWRTKKIIPTIVGVWRYAAGYGVELQGDNENCTDTYAVAREYYGGLVLGDIMYRSCV